MEIIITKIADKESKTKFIDPKNGDVLKLKFKDVFLNRTKNAGYKANPVAIPEKTVHNFSLCSSLTIKEKTAPKINNINDKIKNNIALNYSPKSSATLLIIYS